MENGSHIYVFIILVPLTAAILAFLWQRLAVIAGITAAIAITVLIAAWIGQDLQISNAYYFLGGWHLPLGIALYADGFSAAMLTMTAIVGLGISIYASAYFSDKNSPKSPARLFWPIWLIMWSALNALFLSADIFNIYVTLELVSLAAVALVALAQNNQANKAALRYLLVSLFGSLCYLLGVGLLYSEYGILEFALLREAITLSPVSISALALMSTGLIMKAALFPMHFWLPPAHGSAPAPVSALLSALVVKAAVYLLFRLWFNIFDDIATAYSAQLIGAFGAAAILWGSLQALRAERLKLLVAYSTVAQIGYFFLAMPLVQGERDTAVVAVSGAVYLILSHALAKAAMFASAGTILHVAGHDRLKDLAGTSQCYPVTVFTIAIAGVSLVGLPPSGGFMGKWLLLQAAFTSGQWWWVVILLIGSLLAAGYIFRVITHAFTHLDELPPTQTLDWRMQWPALIIAVLAMILGLLAYPLLELMGISGVLSDTPRPAVSP